MDIIEQIHKHNVNVVNNMFLHDSLMQDMMNDKVVREEMNSVISRLLEGILQQKKGGELSENIVINLQMPNTERFLHRSALNEINLDIDGSKFIKCAIYEFSKTAKCEWADKYYGENEQYIYGNALSALWWKLLGERFSDIPKEHDAEIVKWMANHCCHHFMDTLKFDKDRLHGIASGWEIKTEDILNINYDYRKKKYDEYFARVSSLSDEDLRKESYSLYQLGGLFEIGDDLNLLLCLLLKADLLNDWLSILYKLKTPVLQTAMVYQIQSPTLLQQVLDSINMDKVSHPITFAAILERRWFDNIVDEGNNLFSYKNAKEKKDQMRIRVNDRIQNLGCEEYEKWNETCAETIAKGIKRLKEIDNDERISKWLFSIPMRNTRGDFSQSGIFNKILNLSKEKFIEIADEKNLSTESTDFNYLLFLAAFFIKNNAERSKKENILNGILKCLFEKDNKIFIGISNEDIEKLGIVSTLITGCYSVDSDDIKDILNKRLTIYEGHLRDLDCVYWRARVENILFCIYILFFDFPDLFQSEDDKHSFFVWLKKLLFSQVYYCDIDYLINENYKQSLILMGLVCNQICKDYQSEFAKTCIDELDDIALLLEVLSFANIKPVGEDLENLKGRIDQEWSIISKKHVYATPNYKTLVENINNYIKSL